MIALLASEPALKTTQWSVGCKHQAGQCADSVFLLLRDSEAMPWTSRRLARRDVFSIAVTLCGRAEHLEHVADFRVVGAVAGAHDRLRCVGVEQAVFQIR